MQFIWKTIIYQPLSNLLVFTASIVPGKSLGLAVVIVTLLIRLILLPLSKRSIKSQYALRALEPKIRAIKEKKLEKQEEAKELFALYKEEKVNPFSGCLLLIIQLPILIALYQVFMKGLENKELFYNFINPLGITTSFLSLDITTPSLLLAILAGVTQGVQAFLMPRPATTTSDEPSFQAQLAKSMSFQTRYILPVFIVFIAARLAGAVSLYWVVSNLFSIGQELYFRNTFRKERAPATT